MSVFELIKELKVFLERKGLNPEEYFPSCIGCGYCCLESICWTGFLLYGSKYPCPSLYWNGERYRCNLADVIPDRLRIGTGCCNPNNERRLKLISKGGDKSE